MRKMSNRVANLFSLILNIVILFLVWHVISGLVHSASAGNMTGGWDCLKYFTVLSNILCAAGSLLMIPFNLATIFKNGDYRMPWGVTAFKFSGAVSLMLTLIVCVCFLAPNFGVDMIFGGPVIFLHLIIPILAFIGIVIFDRGKKLRIFAVLFGFLPAAAYGTVYTLMVLTLGKWEDFYGFNSGELEGMWKTSFTFMLIATAALSFVMWLLNRIFCIRKGERKEQIERSRQAKAKKTLDEYKEPQFAAFNDVKKDKNEGNIKTDANGAAGNIALNETEAASENAAAEQGIAAVEQGIVATEPDNGKTITDTADLAEAASDGTETINIMGVSEAAASLEMDTAVVTENEQGGGKID